jgi:hypothetical protein
MEVKMDTKKDPIEELQESCWMTVCMTEGQSPQVRLVMAASKKEARLDAKLTAIDKWLELGFDLNPPMSCDAVQVPADAIMQALPWAHSQMLGEQAKPENTAGEIPCDVISTLMRTPHVFSLVISIACPAPSADSIIGSMMESAAPETSFDPEECIRSAAVAMLKPK